MAATTPVSSKPTFVILTVTAVLMLFGFLIASGGMSELFITMWTRKFSDGSPRYPVYTGVAAIDFLIAMPVSFWTPAVTGGPAIKLQSVVLYPALQVLATWATIESFRKGDKPLMLRWGPASVFLWMWMGTGMFMPMYCYYDLCRHFGRGQSTRPKASGCKGDLEVPYYQAVSFPAATILAYLWPFILIHFPPSGTTDAQLQAFIALNQFGSLFCYVLVAGGSTYLSSNHTTTATHSKNADAAWIKVTYAIFGGASGLVQLAVLGILARSRNPDVDFSEVFVPKFAYDFGVRGTEFSRAVRMVPEIQFFLQWDYIMFVLTTAVWAERMIEAMYLRPEDVRSPLRRGAVVVFVGIVSFILNPGTVLAAILYVRESFVRGLDTTGLNEGDGITKAPGGQNGHLPKEVSGNHH